MNNIDEILKVKYPISPGMSHKNCNKAIRSRHYFKKGYLYAKTELSQNTPTSLQGRLLLAIESLQIIAKNGDAQSSELASETLDEIADCW